MCAKYSELQSHFTPTSFTSLHFKSDDGTIKYNNLQHLSWNLSSEGLNVIHFHIWTKA